MILDEEERPVINQVSSTNVKHIHFGNTNLINNNEQYNTLNSSSSNSNNSKFIKCITEPDEYFIQRPHFPFINITPTRHTQMNYNINNINSYCFHQGIPSFNNAQTYQQINNYGMYVNTNMILTNTSNTYNNSKGSFVSTQYSSNKNNDNKLNSNDDVRII